MPKLYRKTPIIVEGVQWTGENIEEIATFTKGERLEVTESGTLVFAMEGETEEELALVPTLHYIIKGPNGEFFMCRPDVFEALYQPKEDPNAKVFYGEYIRSC